MKITLINPLMPKERWLSEIGKSYWAPIGLGYLSAVLKSNRIEVVIVDRDFILRSFNYDIEIVDRETLDKCADSEYIGITMALPNFDDVKRISILIKRKFPDKKIIIGGPQPSLEADLIMRKIPEIDITVHGEGEKTIIDLLESSDELSNINGISFRSNGQILKTSERPSILNIDDIPMPDWSALNMPHYTRPGNVIIRFNYLKAAHIFGSRGCPFNCDFCAGPKLFPKLRLHSADRIFEEINYLYKNYNINGLYFADDHFLSVKERTISICEKLITSGLNKKIKWSVQIRAKSVEYEILSLMKKAGCFQVEFGFESGSQKILDSINKKASIDEYFRAIEITKKVKLRILANIIVGFPGETENDIILTADFMRFIRPNIFGFYVLMPLPGTKIFEKYISDKENFDYNLADPLSPKFNITAMSKDVFEKYYFEIRRNIVFPTYAWDYIKYNFITDFKTSFIYLYRLFKMLLFRPKAFFTYFKM